MDGQVVPDGTSLRSRSLVGKRGDGVHGTILKSLIERGTLRQSRSPRVASQCVVSCQELSFPSVMGEGLDARVSPWGGGP